MILLLLLLAACVRMGLSYGTDLQYYGDTYRIWLQKAHSLEVYSGNSPVVVLWTQDSDEFDDGRRKVENHNFVISKITQEDSGRYTLRDKNQRVLWRRTLMVEATTSEKTLSPGDQFSVKFDLEPKSCNIYFSPGYSEEEIVIVREGVLQYYWDATDCEFELSKPCGVVNNVAQSSCSGYVRIRDPNGNLALEGLVEVESEDQSLSLVMTVVFAVAVGAVATCCMKFCCCRKSTKKDRSESAADDDAAAAADNAADNAAPAAAQPAVYYHKYDREPAALRSNQLSEPSGTPYPTPPSYALTDPLIHNPPTVNLPPAYSEAVAPAEQTDAPTIPVNSNNGPRFEVTGMTFNLDSTHCYEYTSDKLNFL